MATYSPEAAALTRASLRWNYSRGNIWPGPQPPPPLEPLEEATLAALKRSLRAEVAPVPQDIPPKPAPQPVSSCRPIAFAFAAELPGIGQVARTSNTYRFPIILRRVSICLRLTYNAGNRFNLVWGSAPTMAGAAFGGIVGKLFDDEHEDGYLLQSASPDFGAISVLSPNLIIPESGMRLMVGLNNAVAAVAAFYVTGVIEVMDPEAALSAFQPVILPTQVFVRSITTAPLPAARPASTPRGLRIKVLQAGQVMYSRDVAWISADAELKRQFYDAQLTGRYPPTMEPIW